jgi:hypothetical protein
MQTKWRVMPRCFGNYELLGEHFDVVEAEEICVGQDSLSFADYLECREIDMTIEITHNVNMFRELRGLTDLFGLSWFDFLMRFHERRRQHAPALADLYDAFRENTTKPLWESREELLTFAKGNLDRYLLHELGTNELFQAKAVAFFRLQEELHAALFSEMRALLHEAGCLDDPLRLYLTEVEEYSLDRKWCLLETDRSYRGEFHFDFPALLASGFADDPRAHWLKSPIQLVFEHDDGQRAAIDAYKVQYGTDTLGLGRILMRAHVKRLFRHVRVDSQVVETGFETTYRRALNLYGD